VVARLAGVDQAVPKAMGTPWRDVLAALGAATTAVTGRFGTAGCGSAHGLILSPDVFRFNQRVPKRAPKCVLDSWGGVFCEIRDRGGSAVR